MSKLELMKEVLERLNQNYMNGDTENKNVTSTSLNVTPEQLADVLTEARSYGFITPGKDKITWNCVDMYSSFYKITTRGCEQLNQMKKVEEKKLEESKQKVIDKCNEIIDYFTVDHFSDFEIKTEKEFTKEEVESIREEINGKNEGDGKAYLEELRVSHNSGGFVSVEIEYLSLKEFDEEYGKEVEKYLQERLA